MHVITPLAGPDFVDPDGSIKALKPFQGQPLLKFALSTRPWASKVKHYSFVLYDCDESRRFANEYLIHWFEGCSIVYLSKFSRGAAMSCLAGLSVLDDFSYPLIIDLADIIYTSNVNIDEVLNVSPGIGAIAFVFDSDNPIYSYFACDHSGRVIEAAEKRVISHHASSGTYVFCDCPTFLQALTHAFQNESSQTFNDLFYVCPLFNGVIALGKQIILQDVYDIIDIKSKSAEVSSCYL